ncbi:Arf GTPase activating protein [Carpediemonas membranifera]|uniref:Arf GTPase activating protein n=1 Tax=Carpediemonas membranifera TaxID=201153 RepID=A0A8J6BB87_9EUKA|nr:Arf GTPase activating protein [Carpediemonas membranifera]|eukprot:KAG9397124.1 Arf GTPase activating protein [Carpediemonas membranifera]
MAAADKQKKVKALTANGANKFCCDCGAKAPGWASLNLGVFFCINCSAIHRKMGAHISQCRSVTLDEWTTDGYNRMMFMGNERARPIWEGKLPDNFARPTDAGREQFIRDKYERRKYFVAPTDADVAAFLEGKTPKMSARPTVTQTMAAPPQEEDPFPSVSAPVTFSPGQQDKRSSHKNEQDLMALFGNPVTTQPSPVGVSATPAKTKSTPEAREPPASMDSFFTVAETPANFAAPAAPASAAPVNFTAPAAASHGHTSSLSNVEKVEAPVDIKRSAFLSAFNDTF